MGVYPPKNQNGMVQDQWTMKEGGAKNVAMQIAMSHSPKIDPQSAKVCRNSPKSTVKVLRNQPMRSACMYVAITATSAIAKSQ